MGTAPGPTHETELSELIEAALEKDDHHAREQLIHEVIEMADLEVRAISRFRMIWGGRSTVDRLVEVVARGLLAANGALLREWNAEQMSFRAFVGLTTRRAIVRQDFSTTRGHRGTLTPVPEEVQRLARFVPDDSLTVAVRRVLLLERLRARVEAGDPRDERRFRALFVDGIPMAEQAEAEGVSVEELRSWRASFGRRVRAWCFETGT